MRYLLTICLSALPLCASAQSALREFRIDASHSTVEFSIPFLGHSVRGRFDDVKGTIVYAPTSTAGVGSSAVSVAIATSSINSGSKHRDEHLRSEDFFDAEKYPFILFQSTALAARDSVIAMTGTLTMHGVTRAVVIPFRADGPPADDPHGSTLLHFIGSVRLARTDFGIVGGAKHNDWFDALRSATMGDSVDIALDVEGWRTDFARSRARDGALAKIAAEGVAAAERQVRDAIAKNPAALDRMEWEIDQVSAALLEKERTADAIALLKLNIELFPKSAAARASLGRAHEIAGSRVEARAAAREALALDPAQTRAMELMRRVGR